MKARFLVAAALVAGLVAPVAADRRSDAKAEVTFGMELAQQNLWKEAVAHWLKAVTIDPTYASAWNNLAIGHEQLGNFNEAREAYEKALELDPSNNFIRSNYDQFRNVYDRQQRRKGG